MSGKYQEYISDICIKSNKQIHKCNDCYKIKQDTLGEIENDIECIKYDIENNERNDDDYDYEEEKIIECKCGNEISFTYNPYEIIKKYL